MDAWRVIVIAVLGLPVGGCGGDGPADQAAATEQTVTTSPEDCSTVPRITDFDSDDQLQRGGVGDLRFITDMEARAIQKGASQTEVFCRLDFPYSGLTKFAAPEECDSLWSWAVEGTGPDGEEPDYLEDYATWEFCFRGGKVVAKERVGPGGDD